MHSKEYSKKKNRYDDYSQVLETNEVIHRSVTVLGENTINMCIYSINASKVSWNRPWE